MNPHMDQQLVPSIEWFSLPWTVVPKTSELIIQPRSIDSSVGRCMIVSLINMCLLNVIDLLE